MGAEDHTGVIGAHEERFKTIFTRIKTVEDITNEHVKDSAPYRKTVDRHSVQLEEWIEFRRELRVWALGIICSILIATFWMGGRFAALDKLERMHDREINAMQK